MLYNFKYFKDNAVDVSGGYGTAFDLDGHRIGITECERCSRRQYYTVTVDGETVATRALPSKTILIALEHLNKRAR